MASSGALASGLMAGILVQPLRADRLNAAPSLSGIFDVDQVRRFCRELSAMNRVDESIPHGESPPLDRAISPGDLININFSAATRSTRRTLFLVLRVSARDDDRPDPYSPLYTVDLLEPTGTTLQHKIYDMRDVTVHSSRPR